MRFLFCILFLLSCVYLRGEEVLSGLVKRCLPGYEDCFIFEISSDFSGKDFFEICSNGGKIQISANNPVSAACGLNWYLKYYCNCTFSFCGNQDNLPKKLPMLSKPLRKEALVNTNFYMNYCTFSYTTAFWDWNRWEQEIDLMALNGVTTPMAMVGVEAVWRNVLYKFGYSDNEIKEFLCGPAYFAWFLMGNLEKHGGPLPDEWFERQIELQKKILQRMRKYGMSPVFQAFWGMVPNNLCEKFPDANIIEQGNWMGFKRPAILLPTDTLYQRMAEVWYEEYNKLFGCSDCYAGDLFHEGGKVSGLNVKEIANGIQKAMLKYNPNAKWFIQAWGNNPKESLLAGLDREHTVIIDLAAEYWTRWKDSKGFNGYPWVWSHITNYGGNVGLHGRLNAIINGFSDGISDTCASKTLCGIGSTPEGIEVNPVVFDLVNELRWRSDTLDMEYWIRNYANRRYGIKSKELENAWSLFLHTAYGTYAGHRRPSESVFCAPPSLKGDQLTASAWSQCKIFYNPSEYARGVFLFLQESDKCKDVETYVYDAVDFVRQYLSDLGRITYQRLVEAYEKGDRQLFDEQSSYFLELLLDQDKLLSSHYSFYVGKWLDYARSASLDKELQDLYEYNARQLITTWSDKNTVLRDYGHKEWGGILKDFYYPRWKNYFLYLHSQLEGKRESVPDFYPAERMWVKSLERYVYKCEDPVKFAKQLFEKYYQ